MKKLLAIILTLCMALSFVGCAESAVDDGYYSDYYDDNYYEDDYTYEPDTNTNANTNYSESTSKTTSSTNKTNNNTNKTNNNNYNSSRTSSSQNNTTNNSTSSTENINSAQSNNVKLIYQQDNRDNSHYGNWVRIDKIDISENKMFISYTATKYYGGGYDGFATDAIFYDANNNIIDITQVMYISTFNNSTIGQSFVDDTYIPDGTVTIVINSGTSATKPLISSNHGNSNIKINIPSVCYDKSNYGNSVTVNSYNVYDGKIFTVYTPKYYYGGGYDGHAVDMIFYNSNGGIIETKQALYVRNIEEGMGCPCYDYTYIPEGTASIGIQMGTASSGALGNNSSTGSSSTTSSSPSQSTPSENDSKKWSYSDAKKLDGYIEDACEYLEKAKENCGKGSAYYVLANQYIQSADGMVERAITLLESKSDITLDDGTTLLSKCKELHTGLSELDGVSITTSNVDNYSQQIRSICYNQAVKATSIRLLTQKLLMAF